LLPINKAVADNFENFENVADVADNFEFF